MDVRSFLLKYGNLDDVNQQYLVVLDKNATVLATPVKASIGQNFFAAGPQQGAANISNEHYKIVMSGQEDTALFSYRNLGTRLNTGEPIILNGKQQYSLFVVTPTDAIYAQINSVIASQRTGFYILQGAIASAIGIALYFLIRWSGTLERAVRDRTKELTKSNELLQHANEQLKVHDKLQQEFINVAAHELRTPIQPILGLTGMLQTELDGKSRIEVSREDIEILARNAMRLERLSSDLLTVARLEGRGGEMELHLESFDIQDKLRNVVGDIKKNLPSDHTVEIVYDSPSIIVQADKSKIFEVLSNLIRNAIKFTKAGKIAISASKSDGDGNEVIIRVTDTGAGIDADIMPRLFTKFVSKSGSGTGTGLGLYIARKIVEAHGGKIWAENNKDGKGATFSFSIPLRVTSANLLSGAVQEK
jgi:signal transduction histidine kinase